MNPASALPVTRVAKNFSSCHLELPAQTSEPEATGLIRHKVTVAQPSGPSCAICPVGLADISRNRGNAHADVPRMGRRTATLTSACLDLKPCRSNGVEPDSREISTLTRSLSAEVPELSMLNIDGRTAIPRRCERTGGIGDSRKCAERNATVRRAYRKWFRRFFGSGLVCVWGDVVAERQLGNDSDQG